MKSIYIVYLYTTEIKLMEVKGLTKHVCTYNYMLYIIIFSNELWCVTQNKCIL